jgi:predicted transcriptional regulator
MVVKLSANLSDEVVGTLRKLAEKRGTTMTEVLRQAISTEKFLQDEIDAGSKLLIEDKNHNIRQVLIR